MSFIDLTGRHPILAQGDLSVVSVPSKWGSTSTLFNGEDWLEISEQLTDLWFSSSDEFTIECSVKFTALNCLVYDYYGAHSIAITSDGKVRVWREAGMAGSSDSGAVAVGPVYSLAWCRKAGVSRIFIDGEVVASWSDSFEYRETPDSTFLTVGGLHYVPGWSSDDFKGYMSHFRITRVARYDATYIPTEPVAGEDDPLWGSTVLFVPMATTSGVTPKHKVYQEITTSSSTNHTASIFVTKGTTDVASLELITSSVISKVTVNLTTGIIDTGLSLGTYSVKYTGNGWYRLSCTGFISTGTLTRTNLTFNTTGYILATRAQIEQSSTPTSYIPTTGSTATRAADVITGGGLIYTNAVNVDANWNSSTTYVVGNKVSYASRVFESLSASNTNKIPIDEPTFWIDIGPDNRHAALDSSVSTVSSSTGELILVVRPGAINSCGLVDIDGTVVEFGMTDPSDGFIFNQTVGLASADIYNWYDYFFVSPLLDLKRTQVIFYNLPEQYTDPIVSIKISNGTDTAKLALAAFGKMHELGNVQYGASAGIVDYSVKATDEFGTTTLLQRNYSKRLSAKVILENRDINRVQRLLYSIRATPVVWIGVDDPTYEEAMILWGFYKDFTTEISYPSFALCSVEIEGLA